MGGVPLQPTGDSLAERAYRELRDRLIMLDIPPGAPINDEYVAAELGVGRTPVREALKRLQSERLVIAYPRRGTFATEVNITDLSHITEVRRNLEPVAAACATHRATAADRRQMNDLCAELRQGSGQRPNSVALMRTDMRAHHTVYRATQNPYLEGTLVYYNNLAMRIWRLFTDRLRDLSGHVDEHGALFDAILTGDADKASLLAAQHVTHFEHAIRAVL